MAMRPTALVLNILVAKIATIRFAQDGAFSFSGFWPFALGAVPLAFLGGIIHVPGRVYKPLDAIVLVLAATQLIRSTLGKKPCQALTLQPCHHYPPWQPGAASS